MGSLIGFRNWREIEVRDGNGERRKIGSGVGDLSLVDVSAGLGIILDRREEVEIVRKEGAMEGGEVS